MPDDDQLANFRDLGGLPTVDGSHTRAGVLYRSEAPAAGDRAPDGAVAWPPTVVLDLRSERELGAPSPWSAPTVTMALPLLAEAAPELQERPLHDLYLHMLDVSAALIAQAVRIVGDADADGPVLIHCAAGKDRTGVLVAVLLLAVGVERSEVTADYAATQANMTAVLARLARGRVIEHDYSALPSHLLATPPEAMDGFIDALARRSGGVRGWLSEQGISATELDALSRRLLVTA